MNSKIITASKKISTNITTSRKRISKWLFIAGGLFLIISQSYNFYVSYNYLYLGGFIVGIWMLGQGLFFTYFYKNVTLTIEDGFLEHHHSKTLFREEETNTIFWKDVQILLLSNYNIRIKLKDGHSVRHLLPLYNLSQYQDLEKLLKSYAKKHGFRFKSIEWWKKIKRLPAPDLKDVKKNFRKNKRIK